MDHVFLACLIVFMQFIERAWNASETFSSILNAPEAFKYDSRSTPRQHDYSDTTVDNSSSRLSSGYDRGW